MVNVQKLVDLGYTLDKDIKEKTKDLKKIKSSLKELAKKEGSETLFGWNSRVDFSGKTETVVDTLSFLSDVLDIDKSDPLYERLERVAQCLNVALKKARDEFGNKRVKKHAKEVFNEYYYTKFSPIK